MGIKGITIIILIFVFGCRTNESVFTKEYVVKKINEHEVQLIYKTDTVTLYLENAYGFDERIVFIKK